MIRAFTRTIVTVIALAVGTVPGYAQAAKVLAVGNHAAWQIRTGERLKTITEGDALESGAHVEPVKAAPGDYLVVIYCDLSTQVFTTPGQVHACGTMNALFLLVKELFSSRLAKAAVRGDELPERVVALRSGGRFDLSALNVPPGFATRVTLTPIAGSGLERGPATPPFAPSDGLSRPATVTPGLYLVTLIGRDGRALGDPGWVLLVDETRAPAFAQRFADFETAARTTVTAGMDADTARAAQSMFLRAALASLAADLGR